METFYGVWSPTLGVLPTVDNYDFAAFYITDTGVLDGTTYTKDKWLIYICEARGKLDQRSYWRITDGVVVFNPDSHSNVPDAGYYTKIRLDNAGNIVAGADLSIDDLPPEVSEKFQAITDENLNRLIGAQLSQIFTNNTLNPIQFKYDAKTGKISASLKLDESTININEFGQLYVVAGSGGSGGTVTIDTEALEALKKKVAQIEEQIIQITPVQGKGIKLSVQKGGTVFSVNIDENSLAFDANGKLCVNPDILKDYINSGGGGNCANHTHTPDQIHGLEEFIKKVVNNTSIYNTLIKNLQNIVDQETIIVNKNGKLEAIATHVQKHKHVMNDISNLNQEIANVWATNQRLHKGNNNQDFDKGAVIMSSLTVGEVLIAFNQLLKEYKQSLTQLSGQIGTVKPTEPGLIDLATFFNMAAIKKVLDVETVGPVEASAKLQVGTDDIIYFSGSYLSCYIDGVLKETIEVFDRPNDPFKAGKHGNFFISYFGDAYPKIKTFQGYYKGFAFYYEIDLPEGPHEIYFEQKDINSGAITRSNTINVNIYNKQPISANIIFDKQPRLNYFVSGVRCTKDSSLISFSVAAKNFERYAPLDSVKTTIDGFGKQELQPREKSGNFLVYGPCEIDIGDFYGKAKISATVSNIVGDSINIKGFTDFINYDDSDEEQYRFFGGSTIPEEGVLVNMTKYDSKEPLLGSFEIEAQVKDHFAIIGKTDYTSSGLGQDYSTKPNEQSIVLRFECPKMNNFYFDIFDDGDQAYKVAKNGTLESIAIYASIAPSTAITRWINCNVPYAGHGQWKDTKIFNGLDLFKSTSQRRYVTFGKDPVVDAGYLYLKLIISKPINLKKLVASIKESIDERR